VVATATNGYVPASIVTATLGLGNLHRLHGPSGFAEQKISDAHLGSSPAIHVVDLDADGDGDRPEQDGAGDAEGAPVLFDDVGYDDDVGLAVEVGFGDTVGGIVVLIVGRGVTTRSSAGGVAIWMPEGCVGMMVGTFDASVGVADGGCVDIVSKEIFGMVGRGSVEL